MVAELSGEKIDVIPWNDDAGVFVANALSPAQVISVDIDEEHRIASVTVPERMLSLAIGREGQNARLAARLTGWRIDIRSDVSVAEAKAAAADAVTNGTSEETVTETEPIAAVADTSAGDVAEPVAKPKRATKKTAVADADTDAPAAETVAPTEVPAAKPKRSTKKAAAETSTDATPAEGEAQPAAAAKPKRATKKAPATDPTEEVAS